MDGSGTTGRARSWRSVVVPAVALLVACGRAAGPGDEAPRVLAAASATDVVEALAEAAGGARVAVGASSALARQVLGGAPADVFVSASRRWVDEVVAGREGARTPVVVARNALVVIAPAGGALVGKVADARGLVAALDADARLALADAGVPAGEYAREALASADALDALAPHLVGQPDVRGVLAAVAGGHVDAGVVYRTDALASDDVALLFAFDAADHAPIELVAVALTERGAAFVDALAGEAGRAVLAARGFQAPNP